MRQFLDLLYSNEDFQWESEDEYKYFNKPSKNDHILRIKLWFEDSLKIIFFDIYRCFLE